VFSWVAMLVSAAVIELVVFRHQHSLTVALATALHMIWSALVLFVVVLALTGQHG